MTDEGGLEKGKKYNYHEFFTAWNAHETKKGLERAGLNVRIGRAENNPNTFVPKIFGNLKPQDVTLPTSMDDPDQIGIALRQMLGEEIYQEPPDQAVAEDATVETAGKIHEQLPDFYSRYILPGTCRPSISAIASWVKNVKIPSMSHDEWMNELYGEAGHYFGDPNEIEPKVIDSISYKISRKIWYVGRRPAHMTDHEWNELTKYMRPSEGTYGVNDTWVNFKYDEDYEYTSGVTK